MPILSKRLGANQGTRNKVLVGLVLTTLLAMILGLYIANRSPSKEGLHQAKLTYRANTPTKPITDQYEQQIQHGQQYLLSRIDQIPPFERLIMDSLQRKYGLDPQFNGAVKPIEFVAGRGASPDEFAADRRIAYPDQLIKRLPPNVTDPPTLMDIMAVNCDHIPLSVDFNKLIQTNFDLGGYYLTHVMFALQRMRENSCSYFSAQDETQLRDKVAQGMLALINQPDTIPDLRYESVAFLLDMGRSDLVQPAWIAQIASEQQTGGGWRPDNIRPNTDHASMLALWSLLEYTRPNAPYEPMIHHPGRQ